MVYHSHTDQLRCLFGKGSLEWLCMQAHVWILAMEFRSSYHSHPQVRDVTTRDGGFLNFDLPGHCFCCIFLVMKTSMVSILLQCLWTVKVTFFNCSSWNSIGGGSMNLWYLTSTWWCLCKCSPWMCIYVHQQSPNHLIGVVTKPMYEGHCFYIWLFPKSHQG